MNKDQLKKQIAVRLKTAGKFTALLLIAFLQGVIKVSARCHKLLSTKRTVLFVTNQKIRSLTLGPLSQISLLLLFLWVGNLFVQSLRYDNILNSKSDQISKLEATNNYFEREFENVNDKLAKVSEYLIMLHGAEHQVKAQELNSGGTSLPKSVKEKDLTKSDKHTYKQIKNANEKFNNIHSLALNRIKKIEGAIAATGLNIKKVPAHRAMAEPREVSLNDKNSLFKGQGGPLVESNSLDARLSKAWSDEDDLERHLSKQKFSSEIDYLIVLERLVNVMPFAKPMQNYYISSGFGSRVDPITRRMAVHQGLDFTGITKAKIISPSSGRVILAGQFSDYGNAVVIDHGFGITTRYGHLSEVKVREGQRVKRGDVLALQGSTGRSTGAHLHYEIRYRNTPLNPRKFLEAGENLFKDKNSKYANS